MSGLTVPPIVIVEVPPPAATLTLVNTTLLPGERSLCRTRGERGRDAVAATPVIAAGTVSAIRTSVAEDGPVRHRQRVEDRARRARRPSGRRSFDRQVHLLGPGRIDVGRRVVAGSRIGVARAGRDRELRGVRQVPVAPGTTVPVIVIVRLFPAPALRLAPVNASALPDEPLVPQLAVPLGAQATVTPVMKAGTRSCTSNDGACDGPRLVTVTV